MKGKGVFLYGLLGLIVILGVLTIATSARYDTAPDKVVESFYGWYLGYIGSEPLANPLVDKALASNSAVTARFVAQVEETVASFGDGSGYDPVLLAQDVPERIEVNEAHVKGDAASVTVKMYWGGNPRPSLRQVELVLDGKEWKIDRVTLLK